MLDELEQPPVCSRQRHSGELLLKNHVAIPLGKISCMEVLLPCPSHKQDSSQVETLKGSLHTTSWRHSGIRFIEAKKSTLQEQVDGFSGRSLLGQFGKNTREIISILADTVSRHCLSCSVPADCFEKVVSLHGDKKNLYQRILTPQLLAGGAKANFSVARNRVRRERPLQN